MLEKGSNFSELVNIKQMSVEKCIEVCGAKSVTYNNLLILCIYRSPAGDFATFLNILDHILGQIDIQSRIIVAGDFNVRFCTEERMSRDLVDMFTSYGLSQTIFQPTRGENCLDNIFINFSEDDFETSIVSPGKSDHDGQLIAVNSPLKKNTSTITKKLCQPITQRGKNKFFEIITNIDFGFIDNPSSLESKFETLMQLLESAFNDSFPQKTCKVRAQHTNNFNWFSHDLKNMREHLQYLNDLYKHLPNNRLKAYIQNFRNDYRKAIKTAKIKCNDRKIQGASNPSRCMWEIINDFRGKPSATNSDTDKTNMRAQDFNSYFVNIAVDLQKQIPIENINPIDNLQNLQTDGLEFSFKEVSYNDVRTVIDSLKNKTSRDIYNLNINLIKGVKNLLIIPLTRLINMCIRQNAFPNCLKIARVVPIFKKGEVNDPGNYRPISLLPSISKIVEKCLKVQMSEHMENEGLLNANQFGFREGRNTTLAVLKLVENVMEGFESSQYIASTFCDLSKAFDCVSHDILLDKLPYYKFSNNSITLIKSYLTNRQQTVSFNNTVSDKQLINVGVPQGSILGPILFLLYINDLPNIALDEIYYNFADDTTTQIRHTDLQVATEMSGEAQSRARQWFSANKLFLNEAKTQNFVFSLKKTEAVTDNVRFLGVALDQKLLWDAHTEMTSTKLSKSAFVLRNLSLCVSPEILKQAYFSIFHSHLSYALLVWGHSSGSRRVFALQRRAIRIVAGLKYRDDCKQAFVDLRVLTLPGEYILQNLMYVRDNHDRLVRHRDVHDYDTRNKNNLQPIYHRLHRCQNGPGYHSINFFNKIPDPLKNLNRIQFKRKVKDLLIECAFYSIEEFSNSTLVWVGNRLLLR